MTATWRNRKPRGQTRQEVALIILVCAVALIAMLSVFVPGLRHFWTRLGRPLTQPEKAAVQTDSPRSEAQERR